MALPEHQIPAPQPAAGVEGLAESAACMSESRGAGMRPVAISASCTSAEQSIPIGAAPAPEIGRAEQAFGHGDEIRGRRPEMGERHVPAAAQPGEAGGAARDVDAGEEGQSADRHGLDVGLGIDVGRARGDGVRPAPRGGPRPAVAT
jgi:hypothetical protein